MKLKDVLDKTFVFFREKGFPSARLDAELLLADALGIDRIRLYLDFDRPLSEDELARCREPVRRRSTGEPVAYILGKKDFFGLRFDVEAGVLIPRPETEHLVEVALAHLSSVEGARVVDLGCGSGCVGLSVLKNAPSAKLLSLDLSTKALEITQKNADVLGFSGRTIVLEGDAASPSAADSALKIAAFEQADVILANPPYIDQQDSRVEENVRKFEPASALFAEDHGLRALKDWSTTWFPRLAPGGLVAMEMGLDQGPALRAHFEELGCSEVTVVKDLAGHDRVIKGVKNG